MIPYLQRVPTGPETRVYRLTPYYTFGKPSELKAYSASKKYGSYFEVLYGPYNMEYMYKTEKIPKTFVRPLQRKGFPTRDTWNISI